MSEWLNGIFECLDINSSTGLATEDSLQSMSPFQRLFYTQVHEKIGIDAVFFFAMQMGLPKFRLSIFPLSRNMMQSKLQSCIVFRGISVRLLCCLWLPQMKF